MQGPGQAKAKKGANKGKKSETTARKGE